MGLRRYVQLGLEAVAVLIVVSLVLGSVLGQPILLSYVETGSMEPTMEPGDGFVAIPAALAGPNEEGDVITFEAQEIQGGGLTTHRVAGETDRGFVTKGDANPFTDQDSDEPPVRSEQIVAVAWQPGGTVVTIPHFGTAVEGIQGAIETLQVRLAGLLGTRSLLGLQGMGYLLFGLTAVLYVVDLYFGSGKDRARDRDRDTGTNARLFVGAMALGLVIAATAAMAGPAGVQEFTIVSSEFDSDRPFVIEQGETTSVPYSIGNSGVVPAVVFLEPGSEAVEVEPRELHLGPQSVVNTSMTLSAPPETGAYRRYVVEHRYLALLPRSVIRSLHGIHPWLPVVAIDALIGIPFYLVGTRFLGTGRLRTRSRDKPSRMTRLYHRLL